MFKAVACFTLGAEFSEASRVATITEHEHWTSTFEEVEDEVALSSADKVEHWMANPLIRGGNDGSCPAGTTRVSSADCPGVSGRTIDGAVLSNRRFRVDCAAHFTPGEGCFMNTNNDVYATGPNCASAATRGGIPGHFAVCEQTGWNLILQYGATAYQPNAGAVGTLDENQKQHAKLSDAAINAIPSGGDAGYDYYKLTSEFPGTGTDGAGADPNLKATLFLRVRGAYDDLSPTLGFTSWEACDEETLAACTTWEVASGASLGIDTYYSWGQAFNDCRRWFTGYGNRHLCYGDMRSGGRCWSVGYCDTVGRVGTRQDVKMYKLAATDPWTLVLQYGATAYPPNTGAVGTLNEGQKQHAKLSDAAINALPSGGDAGYDYYKLTSESTAAANARDTLFLRVPAGTIYDDSSTHLGFEGAQACMEETLDKCDSWMITLGRNQGIDTIFGTSTNNCDRWLTGIYGTMFCYSDPNSGGRCWSSGAACPFAGTHALRQDVKMYRLTA